MEVVYDRPALPVLYECHVLVIGGSFGGVTAAVDLARAGRRVALVEPRTYLGREVTATLRPWLRLPKASRLVPLPEVISACIEAGGTSMVGGECPLHMDAVKLCLEDLLLDAGVKLLYASLPVGVNVEAGRLRGVVIGNKSGRQVILCQAVIDATETALGARLAGAGFEGRTGDLARYCATIEFDGAGSLDGVALAVPGRLGLVDNQVLVHAGYRGAGHLLLEAGLALPGPSGGAPGAAWEAMARREVQARRMMTALAACLRAEVPAFEAAFPAATSYELHGPHTTRLAGPAPDWAQPLATLSMSLGAAGRSLGQPSVVRFAGHLPGLWCLSEAARVDEDLRARIGDPFVSSHLGAALAHVLHARWTAASVAGPASGLPSPEARPAGHDGGRLAIREPDRPQRGCPYRMFPVAPCPVPVLRDMDVVVVGGGSSGAVAGIVSGQEGMRTVLVDMNPGLGGTGTYGGIYTYWFGQSGGFVERLMDWLGEMHDRLRLPRPEGVLARWNVEARTWALMEQAERAGVELWMNALAIGTIVDGSAVRGVVVATRFGPAALLGRVVIEATGDGDVAAFAGAECAYGSAREQAVMYGYMPQVPAPGRPRNVKTSMVDVRNVEDYTRMILAERRRRQDGDHDHGIYLAPRESRHVQGDVVLTLTDQLVRRCWPDVVTIAFSNHDIKGESTSDWIRMGLQAPNLEIEIPYRALLPTGLENILVAGKAFSATHDASAAPRMQRDLENLGGTAAIAAAMAVRAGVAPRHIDLSLLQARLVEAGVLPRRVLDRTLAPLAYSDDELRALIVALDAARPLHAYADAEVGEPYEGRIPPVDSMCAGPRVIAMLEQALDEAVGPRRVLLARMLAVLGSTAGVPVLLAALEDRLSGASLPQRGDEVRHVGYPPDQGAAPDAAHLLYCLGLARDRRALPVWQRVVDLLATATREEVFDRYQALYFYVSALCYGVERLGDPDAISMLLKLHGYPVFRGHAATAGCSPDYLEERLAHLELLIGRALARCGSPGGYVLLIGYLQDVRTLLAEHAHSELVSISGRDFGKDAAAWGQWLEAEAESLCPVPWHEPSDPVAAWDQEFLIET